MLSRDMVGDTCCRSATVELQVVQGCLQAASVLHADQLVQWDFRYANVLWDIGGPFVIALEMAERPPLQV